LWDGQLELVSLQWVAFYALFLLRTAEEAHWRDAVIAGCFLALIGYTSWYYLLFFAIYSILFVLIWSSIYSRRIERLRMLGQMGVVVVVGGLLLSPCLAPALQLLFGSAAPIAISAEESDRVLGWIDTTLVARSANALDFWLPSPLHPLWGKEIERIGQAWHPNIAAWNVSLGYVTLALALLGGIAAWRAAWRWWVLALAGLVLAMGPILSIGAMQTSVLLPYALLLRLPAAGIANRPSHFVVITTLVLAPLVALGLRWLSERLARRQQALLLGGIIVLLAVEYAPPLWPRLYSDVHPYYNTIARSEGALLEVPPQLESSAPLRAQMVHELPIVGGFIARIPDYPFGQNVPGVRQLWRQKPRDGGILNYRANDPLVALNFYNVRHLVIHWDLLSSRQQRSLISALDQALPGATAVYSDTNLSAYLVPPVTLQPFAYLNTGWSVEERDDERRWRWMGSDGDIVLVNPEPKAIPVQLRLRAESYLQPRTVKMVFDRYSLGEWVVDQAETTIVLHLLVPPGEHRLRLQAPVDQERDGKRLLSIVLVEANVVWKNRVE
jgi:hypothetical protein